MNMNINRGADAVLEVETLDGKETIRVICENCGDVWELEDGDVVLEPWPRFECPHCGNWIPLF